MTKEDINLIQKNTSEKETTLIYEILQLADGAMNSDDLEEIQQSYEKLDLLEEKNDLCMIFLFNTHLLFNRLM